MRASTASTGLSVIMIVLLSIPACATDWDFDWDINRHKATKRHYRKPKPAIRYYADPRSEEERWREEHGRGRDRDRDGFECLPILVEVVSTEHNSEENAKEAARKLWMVQVSWKYGGRFIDLENAADYRDKCGPSNPMDTVSGRLIEGAQKLVGSDGQNVRCVIRARPCSAPLESANKEGR